jgi:hypothetical protein
MNKQLLKNIRNKMIKDMWLQKKAEWEMKDIAYLFGLEIAQIYRILKAEVISK